MASPTFERVGNSAKLKKQLNEGKMGGLAGTGVEGRRWRSAVGAHQERVLHGLEETKDYQAGLAQLQAGLKSTGDASGMTAQGMEKLATKIQGYSGQTDDRLSSLKACC
jgi:hypothetical protein